MQALVALAATLAALLPDGHLAAAGAEGGEGGSESDESLHQLRAQTEELIDALQERMAEAEAASGPPSSEGESAAPQAAGAGESQVCVPCDPQPTILGAGSSVRSGSDQRRQQLKNRTGPARRERVDLCLQGRCGVVADTHGLSPMVCLGMVNGAPCPARLHGMKCAQLVKGHTRLSDASCALSAVCVNFILASTRRMCLRPPWI